MSACRCLGRFAASGADLDAGCCSRKGSVSACPLKCLAHQGHAPEESFGIRIHQIRVEDDALPHYSVKKQAATSDELEHGPVRSREVIPVGPFLLLVFFNALEFRTCRVFGRPLISRHQSPRADGVALLFVGLFQALFQFVDGRHGSFLSAHWLRSIFITD